MKRDNPIKLVLELVFSTFFLFSMGLLSVRDIKNIYSEIKNDEPERNQNN